jgi:aquaporin Z
MTGAAGDEEEQHAAALERRYLIRFEENLLKSQPLSIRLIVEFVGTFLLVTVVVGAESERRPRVGCRNDEPAR